MLVRFLVLLLLLPCSVAAQEIFQPERIEGVPESAQFVDLRLKIESANCPSWGQCSVRAFGYSNGHRVGLEVRFQRVKPTGGALQVMYSSVGQASDQFLVAMAKLYRLPVTKSTFTKHVVADLVALQATKDQLYGKAFFFANGSEERYAELYTNVDLRQGFLWIKEKDSEYRENVLKAFSQ